jgi:hypothetical protein
VVLSVAVLAGSDRDTGPRLDGPVWTGTVSLNGFALGADSLYQTSTDARWATGRDLATGRLRWRLGISGQPESIADVGSGVAAVTTREPADGDDRGEYAVAFVRESTGTVVARAPGYFYRPGAAGAPLVVLSRRRGAMCAEVSCVDVSAWDLPTATVRWRRSVAPGGVAVPSFAADGTFTRLAVTEAGTTRLHDVVTGAVVAAAAPSAGQVVLTRDVLVTALARPGEVVVTAYRRPTLDRIWSVTVGAPPTGEGAGPGTGLTDCGSMVGCLYPAFLAGRVIATPPGAGVPQARYRLVHGIGHGLFLARSAANPPVTPPYVEYVVDRTGRVLGTLPVRTAVPWYDSGGRTLRTRPGPRRTEFLVADGPGSGSGSGPGAGPGRSVGSVPGTNLTCAARGPYLACSDPAGALRVWRIRT